MSEIISQLPRPLKGRGFHRLKDFCENIRHFRTRLHMIQAEPAEKLEVTVQAVVMLSIIEPDYLSRVDGILNAAVCAGVPVTSLITSALSAVLPLPAVFILFACLCLLSAFGCSFVRLSKQY